MPASSHIIDRIATRFDDHNVVVDAGLLLTATLSNRLGLEQAANEMVSIGHRPGRKLTTLVDAILAGGNCIDDVDVLRTGATASVLGHDTLAASTVGTWLRSMTFGHVRQLDKVTETMLTRAWAAGAGPGDGLLTIDIDSTIVEVHGKTKQGASYGYTRQLGLHPLVATRADTGEVLHARTRKGSAGSGKGAPRFLRETFGRVRRAGATGQLLVRADSGFWSRKNIAACEAHKAWFSVTVPRHKVIVAAIDGIDEGDWVDIDYPGARAQVAEATWDRWRLVVRRTLNGSDQPTIFEDWRHHAFVTNRPGDVVELDAEHRAHAVVELAIRDLKHGAGMNRMPSAHFQGNAAWVIACTLAHNLSRWSQLLTGTGDVIRTTPTFRRRMLRLPGRLVRTGRRLTLRLPTRWPWRTAWLTALADLRGLPQPC